MSPSGGTPFSASTCAAEPLAAQIEGAGRVGQGPGQARAVPVSGAAQPAASRQPVDEREREGLQVDRDVEVAGAERHLPWPSRREAVWPATLASSCDRPSAVWPAASSASGGRPAPRVTAERHARRRHLEARVRSRARAGDPRACR